MLFFTKGINLVKTMSCWTDTIFVIEEKNLARVIKKRIKRTNFNLGFVFLFFYNPA